MDKKTSYSIAVCISLALVACGGAESEAKKAVLERLKDPDSAKFGKFTNIKDKAACLTVNARNSLGGYTGDQQAMLLKVEKGWRVVYIDNKGDHDACVEVASSVFNKK